MNAVRPHDCLRVALMSTIIPPPETGLNGGWLLNRRNL